MIIFVLGKSHSGKSLYAERQATLKAGKVTYIGTLPSCPCYLQTIEQHKARRPLNWQLIELIQNPLSDCNYIESAMKNSDQILIDGLTFYIYFQLRTYADDMSAAIFWFADILRQAAFSRCVVYVIDTPLLNALSPNERRIVQYFHAIIIRYSAKIVHVLDGVPREISRKEARFMDC